MAGGMRRPSALTDCTFPYKTIPRMLVLRLLLPLPSVNPWSCLFTLHPSPRMNYRHMGDSPSLADHALTEAKGTGDC